MRALPWLVLALPLAAQGVDPASFEGDPARILATASAKALDLKPRKPEVLAMAGRVQLRLGERAKAEALFIRAERRSAEAQRLIGQAWLEAGDAPRAEAAFRALAESFPREKNILSAAAANLMDGQRYEAAERMMEAAYALDPRDWENVMVYGRACLRQKRQDLAAQWFARITGVRRKEEGLWNELALAFADGGEER
jgi:predicted Zn-dependent protease